MIGLAEVRDAIAPLLGARRPDQRAAVARCLADAPPCDTIADVLAVRIEEDPPLVADAAFMTLRRWTGAAPDPRDARVVCSSTDLTRMSRSP